MLWQVFTFRELNPEQLYTILRLRQQVFVVEQDCIYLDTDNLDQGARHMLGTDQDRLLAYQRCIGPTPEVPDSRLGRIVVSPEARGQQLGRELVQRGIDHNLDRWPGRDIRISAQAHLQGFYSSLGFTGEGEEYLEDNIPHRRMRYRARC